MRYVKITTSDVANGLGVRTVLWVSGCKHHCPGCHNPETHSFKAGREFTAQVQEKLFEEISKDYISGLTLSGGDPLYSLEDIKVLCKAFKERFGDTKDIWLYTGYTFEEAFALWPTMGDYISYIVEGLYVENCRNVSLAFRGSENQNIWEYSKGLWFCVNTILDNPNH